MNQALKLECTSLHIGKFVFTYRKDKQEFISGSSDCLVKILHVQDSQAKETIDENDEITAIAYGCGKLAYSQGSNLHMVKLDDESKYIPSSATLLTNFCSPVRKVLFNEKHGLVLAFSEDNDLHSMNLASLDVFKYKTNNEVSLKNMAVSPDGRFLLTVGCDGILTVYDFSSDSSGKISLRKGIRCFNKSTIESKLMMEVAVNGNNVCAIAGNIFLRTLILSDEVLNVTGSIIPTIETSMSHKSDISMIKWAGENILFTCDMENVIKVWDYSMKTCLFEYAPHKEVITDLLVFQEEEKDKNKNINIADKTFRLAFADCGGLLNLMEKIEIKTQNQFKDVKFKIKSQKTTELDEAINDLMKDIPENQDEQKVEVKSKSIDEENLLNLSDLEDENGEIKNKEEIEKSI